MTKSLRILLYTIFGVAITISVTIFLTNVLQATRHKSWLSVAPGKLSAMAFSIEKYRREEGGYPKTLLELTENTNFSDCEWVKSQLSASNGFCYAYKDSSNGFIITVFSSPGHLDVDERITKEFTFEIDQ